MIRHDLEPPYYLVTFSSVRTEEEDGYGELNDFLFEKAKEHDGLLGVESVRNSDREGITLIFFRDLKSLERWRKDLDHSRAKALGKKQWYTEYRVRVAKVEHHYGMEPKDS